MSGNEMSVKKDVLSRHSVSLGIPIELGGGVNGAGIDITVVPYKFRLPDSSSTIAPYWRGAFVHRFRTESSEGYKGYKGIPMGGALHSGLTAAGSEKVPTDSIEAGGGLQVSAPIFGGHAYLRASIEAGASIEETARAYIRPFVFDIGAIFLDDSFDLGFGAGYLLKQNDLNGFDSRIFINFVRATVNF